MRKEHKSPSGGLTEAGRKHFERKEGGDLKPPVKKGVNPRRVSFAARFAGMNAKMKDDKGKGKKGSKLRKSQLYDEDEPNMRDLADELNKMKAIIEDI